MTALVLLVGVGLVLYPFTSRWLAQVELTALGSAYDQNADANPDRATQLADAATYNASLPGIASMSELGGPPAAPGTPAYDRYLAQLSGASNVMGRLEIPKIDVDLPIYHGTTDSVLQHGVGHLFGTSLPVGGANTHAVLTAHSGLADRVLFTFLDRLARGDTFDVHVLGETHRYQVTDIAVVTPEESARLAVRPGEDLVTLITCTPIGVNSHRLMVTGHRVPLETLPQPNEPVEVPGFPWWLVAGVAAVTLAGWYVFAPTRKHTHGNAR